MKVLVLNGSPKVKSDTMHITDAFLTGLNEENTCEIRIRHIIKMDIKPCKGCFACWQGDTAKCIQQDDMKSILEDMTWADLIIWSFPLYCYGMPAHLKAVCDRTLPLAKLEMVEQEGRTYHKSKVDFSKKRYVMISGCGFPNLEKNFEPAILQFKICFGVDVDVICISEAPLFSAPEAKVVTEPKLQKIREAGRKLYSTGKIPEELINELARPMIPNKNYIRIVNATSYRV